MDGVLLDKERKEKDDDRSFIFNRRPLLLEFVFQERYRLLAMIAIVIVIPIVVPVPVAIVAPLVTVWIVPGVGFIPATVPLGIQSGFRILSLTAVFAVLTGFMAIVLLRPIDTMLAVRT